MALDSTKCVWNILYQVMYEYMTLISLMTNMGSLVGSLNYILQNAAGEFYPLEGLSICHPYLTRPRETIKSIKTGQSDQTVRHVWSDRVGLICIFRSYVFTNFWLPPVFLILELIARLRSLVTLRRPKSRYQFLFYYDETKLIIYKQMLSR